METVTQLLARLWQSVFEATAEHLVLVPLFTAAMLLLIRSIRNRILDLSGYFVPVRINGKWDTTIEKDKEEQTETRYCTGNEIAQNFSAGPDPSIPLKEGRGSSESISEESEEDHETAVLHQFFNKVWGKTESKNDPEITFKLRGQIVGEKLTLVYRETEGFKCGAILLEIRSLKLMEGLEVGCHRESPKLFSKTYTWKRRRGRLN